MVSDRYGKAFRNDAIFLGVCAFTLCVLVFTMVQVQEIESSIPEEITVYHNGNDNIKPDYTSYHGKIVIVEEEIDNFPITSTPQPQPSEKEPY